METKAYHENMNPERAEFGKPSERVKSPLTKSFALFELSSPSERVEPTPARHLTLSELRELPSRDLYSAIANDKHFAAQIHAMSLIPKIDEMIYDYETMCMCDGYLELQKESEISFFVKTSGDFDDCLLIYQLIKAIISKGYGFLNIFSISTEIREEGVNVHFLAYDVDTAIDELKSYEYATYDADDIEDELIPLLKEFICCFNPDKTIKFIKGSSNVELNITGRVKLCLSYLGGQLRAENSDAYGRRLYSKHAELCQRHIDVLSTKATEQNLKALISEIEAYIDETNTLIELTDEIRTMISKFRIVKSCARFFKRIDRIIGDRARLFTFIESYTIMRFAAHMKLSKIEEGSNEIDEK